MHELGLAGRAHVVVTATLSKALGSQGGAVLGTPAVVEHLVNRARPFIFDTGLAPGRRGRGAGRPRRAARRSPSCPALVRRRVARARRARSACEPPAGAVLSVPMPSPQVALAAQAAALATRACCVGCFRPPSVPDGVSRLRITASAGIADADWARAAGGARCQVVKEYGGTGADEPVVVVTGTGTGVGKTIATAALAVRAPRRRRSVVVVKPVQTGVAGRRARRRRGRRTR